MDVVQRMRSFSSHTTTPSTATDSPDIGTSAWHYSSRPLSDVLSSDQSLSTQRQLVEEPDVDDANPFDSDHDPRHDDSSTPTSTPSNKSALSSVTHLPQISPSANILANDASTVRRPPAIRRLTAGNKVAARVAEYERRMSQDNPPVSPTHDISGETQKKHRTAKPVHVYGLVQRPELFVANPDRRTEGSSDS